MGTFSSTDLRGCPITQLKSWLYLNIVEFTEKMTSTGPRMDFQYVKTSPIAKKLLVTCTDTSLGEVISMAVKTHVHRVWVVDSGGLLLGLVALADMLRVIRDSVLAAQLLAVLFFFSCSTTGITTLFSLWCCNSKLFIERERVASFLLSNF